MDDVRFVPQCRNHTKELMKINLCVVVIVGNNGVHSMECKPNQPISSHIQISSSYQEHILHEQFFHYTLECVTDNGDGDDVVHHAQRVPKTLSM